MLATAADPNIGGRDFDRLMAQHFANDFKSRYKVSFSFPPINVNTVYVSDLAEGNEALLVCKCKWFIYCFHLFFLLL